MTSVTIRTEVVVSGIHANDLKTELLEWLYKHRIPMEDIHLEVI